MLTRAFWIGALDRMIKAVAINLVATIGSKQLNLIGVDWTVIAGIAGGAAVLSLLASIASAPIGDRGTTSMLPGGV